MSSGTFYFAGEGVYGLLYMPMDKYHIPRNTQEVLVRTIEDLQKIVSNLGRAAAEIDHSAFPEAWRSLGFISGSVHDAVDIARQHVERYDPVAEDADDLYNQPFHEDSLLHVFDDTDHIDRAKRPARSPELSALAAGYLDSLGSHDTSRQESRSATVSRAAAKAARMKAAPRPV